MVTPSPEPESSILADESRAVRWAGPAFVACSIALIPWTIYLGVSLPSRQLSPHYNIAWAGFDVLELIALGSTGYFALRRSRYLAITAAAAATLLVVDAWFDIMTSPRHQVAQAIVLATVVELPLAAVCGWLSYHTHQLAERTITLLMRRRDPRSFGLRAMSTWRRQRG
jgi:hypothetical protein